MKKLNCIFLLMLCSISLLGEDLSEKVRFKDLHLKDFNPDDSPNWELKGKTTIADAKTAELATVKVKLFRKKKKKSKSNSFKNEPLNINAMDCLYNLKEKTVTSNKFVQVVNKSMELTGIGFDLDNNTKKLFIRSNVKVVWKKSALKKKKNEKK